MTFAELGIFGLRDSEAILMFLGLILAWMMFGGININKDQK